MKKSIIPIALALAMLLSGCSSGGADVVINADGYEGILLGTESTVVTPASIPEEMPVQVIEVTSAETGTSSETEEEITTTAKKQEVTTAVTKPVTTPAVTTVVTTAATTAATTVPETTPPVTTPPETTTAEPVTEPVTTAKEPDNGLTPIMGTSVATVEQMTAYIKKVNPNVAQSVLDMIPYYLSEGAAEGVRGDIAFAQSCIETANFRFDKAGTGSAVTIDQNNFCGMGVVQLGLKGESFDTPQLGIRAQIQHLKAYGSTEPLNGTRVDNRFGYVTRGCAEYVEWLGIQENPQGKGWAGGKNYGPIILGVLDKILAM